MYRRWEACPPCSVPLPCFINTNCTNSIQHTNWLSAFVFIVTSLTRTAYGRLAQVPGCALDINSYIRLSRSVNTLGAWAIYLAWENSQGHHWFPRGMTSEQRLQKFHTDDWTPPIWVRVVLLIGLAAREIYFKQSEALSHIWVMARHQYGISLLVPQASFRVALRSVGCVFRLRRLRSSEILVSRSVSGKTKQITWHGDKQCDCCSRSLLLLTPTTWFSLVRNRNRNAKSELESERDRR